ncbi:hypothetical protein D3C71_2066570 [compost metagenome]
MIQYLRRRSSASSDSQQTSATTVFSRVAGRSLLASKSPREISRYSFSSKVTDWPTTAVLSEPSSVTISFTVAVWPDGCTTRVSPTLTLPASMRPM